MTTHESDPAPLDVAGAELLDQLLTTIRSYVILPSDHAATAVVLWIASTHALPAWNAAPRLVIKAPEKRCGKSRLLDLIEALCHTPIMTTNASPSAVYRSIGEHPADPPTLLIDEADTIFGTKAGDAHEDLRGLLNAGHQRGRPAIRWDAGLRKIDKIDTFAMVALAGIGSMPDTIEDRAVIIAMRRRAPDETVLPYRVRRDGPALRQLKGTLHGWVRDNIDQLEHAAPDLPVEDRAADTWEPLTAIADLAGGHWPDGARAAAVALVGGGQDQDHVSLRVRLLMDCRTVFGPANALRSAELVSRLRDDPEAPWADLGPGGLTVRRLAVLLRDFDITPGTYRWDDGTQSKGYQRLDFTDAWRRYCPTDHNPDSIRTKRPKVETPSEVWYGSEPWYGSIRTNDTSVPNLTRPNDLGTDGTDHPPQTRQATCITCRQPLNYDDGTHTHPTCTTSEGNES